MNSLSRFSKEESAGGHRTARLSERLRANRELRAARQEEQPCRRSLPLNLFTGYNPAQHVTSAQSGKQNHQSFSADHLSCPGGCCGRDPLDRSRRYPPTASAVSSHAANVLASYRPSTERR